jgi:hypothetical protein
LIELFANLMALLNYLKMKKVLFAIAFVAISLSLFADGDKNKSLGLMSYNPNPASGDVGSALNLYIGPGSSNGFGFSLGGDFEIPLFVDNLTLGPGVNFGLGHESFLGYKSTTLEMNVNAVGYYYFDWLIPGMPDEFDVFANVVAGVGFQSIKTKYDNFYYGYAVSDRTTKNTVFNFETYVGGRWNYSDNMSLYAKLGYGSYYGAVGISFKM